MSMILTHQMRVDVRLGRILMRPTYTKIHNFRIKNPKGYHKKTALSVKEIDMEYKLSELFDTPSVTNEIVMKDIFLGIYFKNLIGSENNWQDIVDNIPKAKKSAKPSVVKKLTMENLTVEIWGKGFNAALKKKVLIPSLTFTDIDSEQGFPTEQLIAAIFGSAGIKEYVKKHFSPDGILKDIFSPFSMRENEEGSFRKEPSKDQI